MFKLSRRRFSKLMKFIEIYNRNKNCADFQWRQRRFKTWSYLSKKNPLKYRIVWDKLRNIFEYEINYPVPGTRNNWIKQEDSSGKYNTMEEYERRTNY